MPDTKILDAVETARKEFEKAKKTFSYKGEALENRANSTTIHISYDGSYERDKARSLIKEGIELSRDLYVICETLIGTLDRICRPLLVFKPGAHAVGAVASLIDEIVKELDDTKVSFNAHLNGSNRGSVESDAFKPSIEARIIQGYWNNEYRSMPDYSLEEKRKQDEKLSLKKSEKDTLNNAERAKNELNKEIEAMVASDADALKRRGAIKEECDGKLKEFEEASLKELEKFAATLPDLAEKEAILIEERRKALLSDIKRASSKEVKEQLKRELSDIEYEKSIVGTEDYIKAQTELCRAKVKKDVDSYRQKLNSFVGNRFSMQSKKYTLSVPPRDKNAFVPELDMMESAVLGYVRGEGCCLTSKVIEDLGGTKRSSVIIAAGRLMKYGLIFRVQLDGESYYVAPGEKATFEVDAYIDNPAYMRKPIPKSEPISFAPKDYNASEYKKTQIEKLKYSANVKKKNLKKMGIAISVVALVIVLCFSIPLGVLTLRFNQADNLFEQGKYNEANEIYNEISNFGDSEKRIETIKAIEEIKGLKVEKAIKRLLDAGVPVEVTYDAQGGSLPIGTVLSSTHAPVATGECVLMYNQASEFSGLYTSERTGYRFYGWVPADYSYDIDDVFKIGVKATWSAEKYTVTFDGTSKNINVIFDYNYSGSKADVVSLSNGQTLKYPSLPTRMGYVFTGWYKDRDCTVRYGFDGKLDSGMTLYAGWEKTDADNAYSEEQIEPSEYATEDDACRISLKYSSEGKAIYRYLVAEEAGAYKIYFKNSSSSSSYAYCLRIYNLTSKTEIMGDRNIFSTFYDSVSFDCQAGDVIVISMYNNGYASNAYFYFEGFNTSESNAVASIDGLIADANSEYRETVNFDEAYTLPTVTRKGYSFLGWYNGETKMESGTWSIASDVTLTAKWLAGGNNIWFNATGGTLDVESIAVTFDGAYTLPTPVRENYVFSGWYDGEVKYESGIWSKTEDVILTAKWVPVSYDVTYNLSGGANSPLNPDSFTVESPKITFGDPVKSGYRFIGWYTDDSYSKEISEIPTGTCGQISVYAKWEIITYTVKYELNGGFVTGDLKQSFTVNDLPIILPSPSKTGLAFIGWSKNTFDGEALDTITEPGDITLIANYMDPNLKLTLSSSKKYYTVTDYLGSATHLEIPAYYNGLPVQEISRSAFEADIGETSTLVSVIIPNTVTKIGNNAFMYCKSLESIVIPDSVTSIGEWAFYGCKSLKEITLSNNLKTIGDICFAYCTSLEKIELPDSVISLGGQGFSGCSSLKSVKLSKKLTSIEQYTFADCSSLDSIELHEGIASIKNKAFYGCSSLTKIIIPKSVTELGVAFGDCELLSIYCRASMVSANWTHGWNANRPVTWGYNGN